MPPSQDTLGHKFRAFNKTVEETFLTKMRHTDAGKASPMDEIDYSASDVDNLLRIEVACLSRNKELILRVLTCEDMMYVSKAIKKCTWLVTDPHFAHIINPHYLHDQLFPNMMTEARAKLLLHIRKHLKDSSRSEEFFTYLGEIDLISALKWLPSCSISFITSRLEQDLFRIPQNIFLRLLRLTIEPLRVYVRKVYWKKPMLEKAMFVMRKHSEEYFDILDTVESGQLPSFNIKYTKLIMKTCPHRVLHKYARYGDHIDGSTLAKYITEENLQCLLRNDESKGKLQSLLVLDSNRPIITADQVSLLDQVQACNSGDLQTIKNLLKSVSEGHLSDTCQTFRLQFASMVVSQFQTHKFDSDMWSFLSKILTKIGVRENKQHLKAYVRSIVVYNILHDQPIPEALLAMCASDKFTLERKKLSQEEREQVFEVLYSERLKKVECASGEELLAQLEQILLFMQAWGKIRQHSGFVHHKVTKLIHSMEQSSHTEAIATFYNRHRVWKKILLNELMSTNCGEAILFNALKHNPELLHTNKMAILNSCGSHGKSFKRFFRTLKIFWEDTLAKDYKDSLKYLLYSSPQPTLFTLLSKDELLHLVRSHVPKDMRASWNTSVAELKLQQWITRHMHQARPKPSVEAVLEAATTLHWPEALASLASVLHSMPARQTISYIQQQKWPESLEKICVLQAFATVNGHVRKGVIDSVWHNTPHSSVRALIFKMSHRSLKKFNDKRSSDTNDFYGRNVEVDWSHFKGLVRTVTAREKSVVYNLLSKFDKMPPLVRADYCAIGYTLLKSLPPRCNARRLMNNIVSKILYNKVLAALPIHCVAEMINDAVAPRMSNEKLDWTFTKTLLESVTSQRTPDDTSKAFHEVLKPILHVACARWDSSAAGVCIVRYNMNGLFSQVVGSYKEMAHHHDPLVLSLLVDTLHNKLSFKENYVIFTNFKLAVEYSEVVSKCGSDSTKSIHQNTMSDLSRICIKTLCADVDNHSAEIWRLFFDAWQTMLNGFGIAKKTQYGVAEFMLDLGKKLPPRLDVVVNVVVAEMTAYSAFQHEDTAGRKRLRERLAAHPSPAVRSHLSKHLVSDGCRVSYSPLLYKSMR